MDGKERDVGSQTPLSDYEQKVLTEDERIFYEFLKLFITDEDLARGKELFNAKYGEKEYERRVAAFSDFDTFNEEWTVRHSNLLFDALKNRIDKLNSHTSWDDVDYRCIAHIFLALEAHMQPISKKIIDKIKVVYGGKSNFDVIARNAIGDADAFYKLLMK